MDDSVFDNLSCHFKRIDVSLKSLPERKSTICFCDNLEYLAGADLLIQAFAELKNQKPVWAELKLFVIGSGKEEEKLRSMTQKLQMEDKIKFVGELDYYRMREYLRNCLCVVYPGREEEFAVNAIEAMAEGACVLAAGTGAFLTLIQDKVTGILFKAEDVKDLTDKLIYIIENSDTAKLLGENAKKKIAQELSWRGL